MTNRLQFLLLITFFLVSCASVQQDEIFREIGIWPNGKIYLGQEFQQRNEIAIQIAPYSYKLIENSFGGAESITVFTDSIYIVESIRFDYPTDYDYDKEVENYKSIFSEELQYLSFSRDTLDFISWKDEKTIFEITRKKGNQNKVHSILTDIW